MEQHTLFKLASRNKYGYSIAQVEGFIELARRQYSDAKLTLISSSQVRQNEFDLAKGGYDITEVDAGVDRLEDLFAKRELARQRVQLGDWGHAFLLEQERLELTKAAVPTYHVWMTGLDIWLDADHGGLRTDPAWDNLRNEPRFQALVKKVGLADKFVGMYVNQWTLDYGPRGREAITTLLKRGADAGLGTVEQPFGSLERARDEWGKALANAGPQQSALRAIGPILSSDQLSASRA